MMSLDDLVSWKTFRSSYLSGAGYVAKRQLRFLLASVSVKSPLFPLQPGFC